MNFFDYELNYYDVILNITDNKVTELSRQLETYLKYKKSTIHAISNDSQNSQDISINDSIQKWELELNKLYLEYSAFLEKYIGPKEDIKMKVMILATKVHSFPDSPEARDFIRCLKIKIKLWQVIHILSELEIHTRPQLLKHVIPMILKLCSYEAKTNENVPDFFQRLKFNYQQLEREYDQLLLNKNEEQNKNNLINKETMLRE